MIERLALKNKLDVYEFLSRTNDKFEDFYLTENRERKFLKGNWSLIEKVLGKQECYGLYYGEMKGILIIFREKGFRPYIKILAENTKYNIDLLKYLKWNFMEIDLYAKFKKENQLSTQVLRTGFIKIGDRGRELLFCKKGIKQIYKVIPKDLRGE